MRTSVWAIALLPLLAAPAVAQTALQSTPPSTWPGTGAGPQLAQERCLICHNPEMIQGQRLTAAQWTKEVTKMVGWGAPLNPREQAVLAAYLAAAYPVDAPRKPAARVRLANP